LLIKVIKMGDIHMLTILAEYYGAKLVFYVLIRVFPWTAEFLNLDQTIHHLPSVEWILRL